MQPIDRSGAARRPPHTTPPIKIAKPARQSADREVTPPRPPVSNRCAPYLGPGAPAGHSPLKDAWQNVEETLFDAPLEEITALGREYIEAHLERAEVTRAVQRFAKPLKEAATRIAPNLMPRWPTFDQYPDAVRLVHAFLYTHAPDPDHAGDTDYSEMCRHAKELTATFARVGRTLSRDDASAATPLLRLLSQRWMAYRHHQKRWQQSLLPAAWNFPQQRLELNESQVHAVLVDPRAKLLTWRNMPAVQSQLFYTLCLPPTDYKMAIELLKDMRERLIDITPQDANYLNEVLDTDELRRREEIGVLGPDTFFKACALVGSLLPKQVVNARVFEGNDEADLSKLPEVMVSTYQMLLLAYNLDHHKRLESVIPTIANDGVAWERGNFLTQLKKSRGNLPRTEAWLKRQTAATGNLQQQHASALAELLVSGPPYHDAHCPETLALSGKTLHDAHESLRTLTRIAIAGKHFEAIAQAHRISVNPSDRQKLENKLLDQSAEDDLIPLTLANAVIEASEALFASRKRPMERAAIARAHMHTMLAELADLTGPIAADVQRAEVAKLFATCLVKPPMHDATGRDTTLLQRRIEGIGKAMSRLALIDLQVHGDYYAFKLDELRATNGGTPGAPA